MLSNRSLGVIKLVRFVINKILFYITNCYSLTVTNVDIALETEVKIADGNFGADRVLSVHLLKISR